MVCDPIQPQDTEQEPQVSNKHFTNLYPLSNSHWKSDQYLSVSLSSVCHLQASYISPFPSLHRPYPSHFLILLSGWASVKFCPPVSAWISSQSVSLPPGPHGTASFKYRWDGLGTNQLSWTATLLSLHVPINTWYLLYTSSLPGHCSFIHGNKSCTRLQSHAKPTGPLVSFCRSKQVLFSKATSLLMPQRMKLPLSWEQQGR